MTERPEKNGRAEPEDIRVRMRPETPPRDTGQAACEPEGDRKLVRTITNQIAKNDYHRPN